MRLLEYNQFDTIYHEHFSYLSLYTVNKIFRAAGLRIWKVEELPTHGGSLRVYGCHIEDSRINQVSFDSVLLQEKARGLQEIDSYLNFQSRADQVKYQLLTFLIEQKLAGKKVVAYGAAAKGNTLINYAGIRPDLLSLVFDAAPSKQGKYMPGSHIPILPPDQLFLAEVDFVLVLPWNIAEEVKQQNDQLVKKGVQFIKAIPEFTRL